MTNLPNDQVVPQIISEIVEIESNVVAIAATMVLRDGTIRTLNAFMEGHKLPLLAGMSLHQNDMCRVISNEPNNMARGR